MGAPPRESIEVRLIAFFPKHRPNTIPKTRVELKGQALIDAAVNGVFDSVKYPKMWPKKAAKWMAKSLRTKDIEDLIKEMVTSSADGGHHNLGGSTKETQDLVITAMIKRAAEWKQLGLKNFPYDEDKNEDAKEDSNSQQFVDVVSAVEATINSMRPEVLKYWPAESKKNIGQMLREKDFRYVLGSIVKGSADGGHNKLGGATADQIKAVVDALMEN